MISIRIYNNGDYVVNNVRPEHLNDHIEYNTKFRFGCALVVSSEIKNSGYLDDKRINEIVSKIDLSGYSKYSEIPYR